MSRPKTQTLTHNQFTVLQRLVKTSPNSLINLCTHPNTMKPLEARGLTAKVQQTGHFEDPMRALWEITQQGIEEYNREAASIDADA